MHCMRCCGLMVLDHLFNRQGSTGDILWRRSRRCMNCGHVDGTEHPAGTEAAQAVVPSSEPDYHDEEVHLGKESYLARSA